jgi:ribulose-5-phosphate 4-epimerase/fuculose-1-phosphate aldolase
VHTHAPELVAYSVSSVPLKTGGGDATPVFDIRKFNNGRAGEVTTPALGRSLAESLGKDRAILLLGHGAVAVSPSIGGAISGAAGLYKGAQLLTHTIALGGTIDPNPRRNIPTPPGESPADARRGGDRAGDHYKRVGKQMVEATNITRRPPSTDPILALKTDLALAGRIIATPELAIVDTLGHISARNPQNPDHFFLSYARAPGDYTVDGIVEYDLNSEPVGAPRDDAYNEIYIHGEIYKTRPDVKGIVHAHTMEMVAFAHSSVTLRAVSNGGIFIGAGLPQWIVGKYNPHATMVSDRDLGKSLADLMGKRNGALLMGHGIVFADSSLYGALDGVYKFRENAMAQQQAILLGGRITYLDDPERDTLSTPVVPDGSGGGPGAARFWEYWSRKVSLE